LRVALFIKQAIFAMAKNADALALVRPIIKRERKKLAVEPIPRVLVVWVTVAAAIAAFARSAPATLFGARFCC
jgi:hypothetical protein